ncbi:45938_t:CDS:2, partial [Gigaspora margarita]
PGYYGQIGLRIISEKLNQIFIETEIINDEMIGAIPNKFDYLFFVVVLETAIRLIMKDFDCEFDSAKDIMVKSVIYSSLRYSEPVNDADIDDEPAAAVVSVAVRATENAIIVF